MRINSSPGGRDPETGVDYMACWAKTMPDGRPGVSVWQHCFTAGEVARQLTAHMPDGMRSKFNVETGVVLAALHDVGKVSPGFQRKCQAWLKRHPLPADQLVCAEGDHAKVGQRALQELLLAGRGDDRLRYWAAVVGAHHGRLKGDRLARLHDGGEAWAVERRRLIERLCQSFGPLPKFPPAGDTPWDCGELWFIAGMIVLADWLASDEKVFPPGQELAPEQVRLRAERQLSGIGFRMQECRPGLCFGDLFPFAPSPLQSVFGEEAKAPGLYLVEGPMGCGKTEAGLMAVYGLLAAGQARGIYFALPTQVTSNRIHVRVGEFLRNAADGPPPRLVHGNSWLLEGAAAGHVQVGPLHASDGRHDGRDWFSSSRRALLAPCGVGTVDQALLGVVAAKHFPLRQYALAGKVVILDEVHSYDLYTGTLIDILIRRLRALGATVIVLSATLTLARRRQLLGLSAAVPLSEDYPLVSGRREGQSVGGDGMPSGTFFEVPVAPGPEKAVKIRLVPASGLAEACLGRAAAGECVLWIRNTVAEAQESYRLLKGASVAGGPEIGLLHARHPLFRREHLEEHWMSALGKDPACRPAGGCVLVSTQVVEQSVDIDADLLVTDLAPTDMLLQRIGRLWRHERRRPAGAERQAWISIPEGDFREMATATEIKEALGASAKVYAPYVLVRTLHEWRSRDGKAISLPFDIRPLLEATYADSDQEPESWRKLHDELDARKERMSMMAVANSNPWQVHLADEEGVQTRWNNLPTAMLLPVVKIWELSGEKTGDAVGLELLDGTRCEVRARTWDYATAKAIHRNLVRVPLWAVRPGIWHDLAWLRDYVPGHAVAGKLVEGAICFLPGGDASCMRYREDLGVSIDRTSAAAGAAWQEHTEDDDEFDD